MNECPLNTSQPDQRFNRGIRLGLEAGQFQVLDIITNHGGPQIRLGQFEADVIQGDILRMTRIQAVSRQHAPHEVLGILVRQFRHVSLGRLLTCAAAGERNLNVAERNPLHRLTGNAADRDALALLARIKVGNLFLEFRLVQDARADVAEYEIPHLAEGIGGIPCLVIVVVIAKAQRNGAARHQRSPISPDDDIAAAEFALGTLDAGERAALAARRQREPELHAAILAWEERLAPLVEAAPSIEPPSDYLAAIEARIHRSASTTPQSNVSALQSRLRRWRAAAVGASGLAAALAIGIGVREAGRQTAPHEFVAVLQKSADSPAFMVSVNLDTRELTVRPVAAAAPAGRSYELWIIDPKLDAPRSLGVLDANGVTRHPALGAFDRSIVADATYAVTVEPPGGSPNGKPSGAPVFVGKLIPVGP